MPQDRAKLPQVDGLTRLRQMADGALPSPPMSENAGYTILSAEPGQVVLTASPQLRHCNLGGTVHGGWSCTVAEAAMGYAATSTLRVGEVSTMIELKINYIKAVIAEGEPLTCTGEVVSRGRSLAVTVAQLVDRSGKVLVKAQGTVMILAR